MERVKFDPKELEPVGYVPGPFPGTPPTPVFNTPISRKENFKLFVAGEKPLWMPHAKEFLLLNPLCLPDSMARGMVTTSKPVDRSKMGGTGMFGVEWEFIPAVNGSMVRPGKPFLSDLEHWENELVFPDINTWDWAGSAEDTKEIRSDGRIIKATLFSGLFERLISFVDMTDAMIGLIDEDTQPAIHRLFSQLCDLYDDMFAKFKEYFDADMIWFHDDWGSQRAPFFSLATVQEMLQPYLKRIVDSAHKHGMAFEFHCCGQVEMLVPAMVEAGCDMWNGQPINDKKKMLQLYGDKLICDSYPEELPPDAPAEAVAAVVASYLEEYSGLRTYAGMHFNSHPLEYRYVYELSRKAYNS